MDELAPPSRWCGFCKATPEPDLGRGCVGAALCGTISWRNVCKTTQENCRRLMQRFKYIRSGDGQLSVLCAVFNRNQFTGERDCISAEQTQVDFPSIDYNVGQALLAGSRGGRIIWVPPPRAPCLRRRVRVLTFPLGEDSAVIHSQSCTYKFTIDKRPDP